MENFIQLSAKYPKIEDGLNQRLADFILDYRDTMNEIDRVRPEHVSTWAVKWETWDESTAKLFARLDWVLYEMRRYRNMIDGKQPQPHMRQPADHRIAMSKRPREVYEFPQEQSEYLAL